MKICPNCAFRNLEGVIFCEDCGRSLIDVTSVATRALELRTTDSSDTNGHSDGNAPGGLDMANIPVTGTARFGINAEIMLRFRETSSIIIVKPNRETTIGRSDVASSHYPNIDLAPVGGFEKGVSRSHAVLHRSDNALALVDMNSANGTQVNGQRLTPNQPRILRDGDELRFGNVVCHIYFKQHSDGRG